ncbi:L-rhamnose-binding lectin SML-like [Halichoeres trimaculatus]|uniref:L-rhamnose-binding lectin SML-like n=1 Tax=Halichoeres trimaculatus TaxID=147232 RepID=UPI003D9E08D9
MLVRAVCKAAESVSIVPLSFIIMNHMQEVTEMFAATCLLMMQAVSTDSVITCDSASNIQSLSCVSGVISVQSSLYGRMDSTTCSAGRPEDEVSNTECAQDGTVDMLKTRCDGKRKCEYTLSVVRTADPCPDTYKYLQTNYTCLPAFTLTTCEHSYAYLYCDAGQEIVVYGADFGRRDQTTCSYMKEASQVADVYCSNPTTLVADRCNGKRSCMVLASSSVFGDSCSGITKYLEVAYQCVCKWLKQCADVCVCDRQYEGTMTAVSGSESESSRREGRRSV